MINKASIKKLPKRCYTKWRYVGLSRRNYEVHSLSNDSEPLSDINSDNKRTNTTVRNKYVS